jgi:DNA-binding CsgD family transcriptional regulator
MSVVPELHTSTVPETVLADDEALVFAAASIVKEMGVSASIRPVREVTIGEKCYRLEGRRLHTLADSTGPILLVHVEPMQAQLPAADVLQKRYGLTRKEACVARLIAEDQTNEEIATQLSISPHTARHHTERVLAKLDVRSRTKVRNALVK